MLKTKCFIVGGMILSSLLQVKAFIPTNNTAACAAAAALAASASASASQAMANKEREQDKDKEPDIVTTVFGFTALLCLSALLFMCLFEKAGFYEKTMAYKDGKEIISNTLGTLLWRKEPLRPLYNFKAE